MRVVMLEIALVGLNLVKNVLHAHGTGSSGQAVLPRKLRRDQVMAIFSQLQHCVVAMEACGCAHFAACTIGSGVARLASLVMAFGSSRLPT